MEPDMHGRVPTRTAKQTNKRPNKRMNDTCYIHAPMGTCTWQDP